MKRPAAPRGMRICAAGTDDRTGWRFTNKGGTAISRPLHERSCRGRNLFYGAEQARRSVRGAVEEGAEAAAPFAEQW